MKFSLNTKVNRIIKYLILSDLIFWSGWGLISPVFAVFIVDKIEGGTVAVVGMATAVHWILRAILRVPVGMFLDNRPGEEDDFWFLFFGLIITSLVPLGYLMASYPWHIYLLQAIFAIGMVMSLSGFSAIFIRHIEKGKEATGLGLEATSVALGTGIAGALGGLLVASFGFNFVFILVGISGFLSAIVLLALLKLISPRSAEKIKAFNPAELFEKERK
jgi:MFS family permease